MSTVAVTNPKGGSWLIDETATIFTREQLSEEHRLIRRPRNS
jgi:hypothetical protein